MALGKSEKAIQGHITKPVTIVCKGDLILLEPSKGHKDFWKAEGEMYSQALTYIGFSTEC